MKTSSERRPPRRAARTTPLPVRREPLTEASGLPTALDRREEEASVLTESIDALQGLTGGILERLASGLIGDLNHEIRNRLPRAPLAINAHGYDPWGLNVDVTRRALLVMTLFYRYYFRVKTYGIENLPV